MTDSAKSRAARKLSKSGASKGGRARASVLTASERRLIAQKAAAARWGKDDNGEVADEESPEASAPANGLPYSMFRGTLTLGMIEMECHVLSDGRRVLTQREVVRVLTGGSDTSNLGSYLARNPLFDRNLEGEPIKFKSPPRPQPASGYEATLLIEICELYLDARSQDLLRTPGQLRMAQAAEIIVRACAKVGIIALIDEATGYQEVRDKRALQLKLQAFIADDMQEWARQFPEEFFLELARLEGIRYSPRSRPLRWGKYVMAFVYDAIDPDVGRELRLRNPDPHYRQNHHQWLKEFGKDHLHDQIQKVVTIMKLCNDMTDFKHKFARVFQKTPLQLQLDDLWGN